MFKFSYCFLSLPHTIPALTQDASLPYTLAAIDTGTEPIANCSFKVVRLLSMTILNANFMLWFDLGQKPTFIFHFIYFFFIFFLHLSVKKKWESGQKTRKSLCRNGFHLPTFEK